MENRYTNIFDAHCHYDDEWFNCDRKALLDSLPEKGIAGVVTSGTNLENIDMVLELCRDYSYIYGAAGIHPECLKTPLPPDYTDRIAKLCGHKKIVALGEIGLDYHWDTPPEKQLPVVKAQLQLAKDLDMPVVFHDREAHGDTMELLRYYKPKGLVHCFSGSVEMMKEVVKLGMYISLGGVVTFKNARTPLELAREVPPDRLLLETDAPYMCPAPYRGKRNDSSFIPCTAEKIAEIRGITPQELINITTCNSRKMYGIGENN